MSPCNRAKRWSAEAVRYSSGTCLLPSRPIPRSRLVNEPFSAQRPCASCRRARPVPPVPPTRNARTPDARQTSWPAASISCSTCSSPAPTVTSPLVLVPSPSQTPRTYGAMGSDRAGCSATPAKGTWWLYSRPYMSVDAISSVVRTAAGRGRRGRRCCFGGVTHWCAASVTKGEPSLSRTSRQGLPLIAGVAATTRHGAPVSSKTSSPTSSSPIVVHPPGVGTRVSRARAFPSSLAARSSGRVTPS